MRLFVALDFPKSILGSLEPLLKDIPAGRPARLEQIHLTLHFIGNVPDLDVPLIKESLRNVKVHPMELRLRGVGCFPSPRRPRILWAGIELTPRLTELKNRIDSVLEALGYPPEKREFHPHITLARLKNPHELGIGDFLKKYLSFETPMFTVKEFYLYSSKLTPSGSLYHKELTVPLLPV